MARIKNKEIQGMSDEDLNKKLEELRKELIKENSQIATKTMPKNPGGVKNTKKIIAQILTEKTKRRTK